MSIEASFQNGLEYSESTHSSSQHRRPHPHTPLPSTDGLIHTGEAPTVRCNSQLLGCSTQCHEVDVLIGHHVWYSISPWLLAESSTPHTAFWDSATVCVLHGSDGENVTAETGAVPLLKSSYKASSAYSSLEVA